MSTNSVLETEVPKSSLREQPNQFEVTIESLQSLLNFYKDQQVEDIQKVEEDERVKLALRLLE